MNAWAEMMLLWSWQSLLIVALVFLAARIAPGRSAAARHSFWLLAILVIAILPAANAAMPSLRWAPEAIAPITDVAQLPTLAVQAVPTLTQTHAKSTSSFLIPGAFLVWVSGIAFCGLRFLRTHYRWSRILASASRIERGEFPVPLAYSDAIDAPVLVGVLRPTILLPANIEAWTDSEERRAILLHELAHVERRDHWLNVFRAALGAVFFFHPAVRYALRRLIVERELACDEHALAAGAFRESYAEVILKVAERAICSRRDDCPAFDTSAEILERRINMILTHQTPTPERRTVPSVARAAIVLGFSALLLPHPGVATELPLAPSEIRLTLPESVIPTGEATVPIQAAAPVAQAAPPTQAATGTFSGTVFDQTGALVRGVSVTLTGPSGVRTVLSDETGAFLFAQVPAGQYSLQARLPNFRNAARAVTVSSGVTSTQGILLQVAGLATQVNVSASRPAVTAGATQPGTSPGPQRIGGDLIVPALLTPVKPEYPADARAAGIQDVVHLRGVIGANGSILSLQLLDDGSYNSQNLGLIKAAMDAVQQWRYKPAILNGVPVPYTTTITINFTLD